MPVLPTDKRVWFISGVSTGLGRTLAEAVLEKGDYVAGTLRQPAQMPAFQALNPERALALHMDVTQPAQVEAAVQQAMKHFGHIDVLVNNSGHGMIGAIEETSDAEARRLFDVNVFGVLTVLRAALPYLRAQKHGLIINMSSQGGMRSFAGSGIYCASKHALEAISESLALELAHLNIKVMIVEPGPFRTDFLGRSMVLTEQVIEDYANTVGQRRANLASLDGTQKGDPVRAAHAIIKASEAAQPPLRLALGEPALVGMREKVQGVLKDWADWEAESLGADYPPDEL
jgi:NAD(P)-dependent dehydrogenase (short-subunit alcohol dehydrogenase family)